MRLRLQRWFGSTTSVIFVAAPLAVGMSDDSGCSSTSQQPLNQEQVQSAFVGNTAYNEETGAFALIDENGSIRAEIRQTDAIETDVGSWTLDEEGNFCVDWTQTIHGEDNCGQFIALGDDKYQWGGRTLNVKAGNPNNL